MSSIIQIWGTLRFPAGAVRDWLDTETDGGREVEDGGEAYEDCFEREHAAALVVATIAAGADEIAEWFLRVERDANEVHLRAALGDDWRSEWLARIGGMARAAATTGGQGNLELVDGGAFVGRLRVDAAGAAWVRAEPGEEPADTDGAEDTGATLEDMLEARG